MAANERPIDDAVVAIKPDFTGFRSSLKDGIARAATNLSVKVPVRIDTRGFAAELRAFANTQAAKITVKAEVNRNHLAQSFRDAANGMQGTKVKVGVDLDIQNLYARLQQIAKFGSRIKVKIPAELDIDGRDLRARISAAIGGMRPIRVNAPVNIDVKEKIGRTSSSSGFSGLVRQAERSASRLKLIDWGGAGVRPINLLQGAVAALSPVLVAMASSAIQASTALAGLGATGIGVAGAVTALTLSFGSVTDYMTQLSASQKAQRQESATSAAAATQSGNTLSQALRAQRDAQWAVSDANKEALAAEEALHDARQQARRDLEDLIEKESDLRREKSRAALDVKSTKIKYDEAKNNFFGSPDEIEAARLDFEDAVDAQSDNTRDLKRTREDLSVAKRKGVEKAPGVVAAKDRVTQAKRGKTRAGEQLKDAKSTVSTGGKAKGPSAAETELKYLRSQLSPAARDLADYLDKNKQKFKELRQSMEKATLPGFTKFLEAIMTPSGKNGKGRSTLDVLAEGAATLGGVIGDTVADIGDLMNTPWFRGKILDINKSNKKSFQNVGDAMVKLFKPLIRIFDLAAPGIERFTGWLDDLAIKFDKWIGGFTDKEISTWFKEAGDTAAKWWKPIEDIIVGLYNIFTASMPAGDDFITRFGTLTKSFRDWSSSKKGQDQIGKFFKFFQDIDYSKMFKIVGQAVLLVGLFKAGKYAANHPVLALLAAFAVKYPEETARVIDLIVTGMLKLLQWAEKHPDGTRDILALIAAYKGLNALRGLKLPALSAIPGGPVTTTVAAAVLYGAQLGWDEWQQGMGKGGNGHYTSWRELFSNLGDLDVVLDYFVDNSMVTLISMLTKRWGPAIQRFFSMTLPNFISGYDNGWAGVYQSFLELARDSMSGAMILGFIDGLTGGAATDLYNKIDGWVGDVIAWFKELFGIKSPSTVFADIGKQLVAGLWQGFIDKWAEIRDSALGFIEKNIGTPLTNAFSTIGTKIKSALATALSNLPDGLAAPVKKMFDWIDTNLIGKLNILLKKIGVTPIDPIAFGGASRGIGKATPAARQGMGNKPAVTRAAGGTVPGFSPNSRADNIPAMLTANEFVHPVSAVNYYGRDFMEQVRTKRFPRYASGGLVGNLFNEVDPGLPRDLAQGAIKKAGGSVAAIAANMAAALNPFGGGDGAGNQEYTGRIPKGLGAVAGLSEKMMAAVVQIHKAFPWASVGSGKRTGRAAITVTGRRSLHGSGLATDWPASMELFDYFVKNFPRAQEIIYSPAGNRQIWYGKPHMYTGKVRATHFNHVHLGLGAGYADGGQVKPNIPRLVRDNGGDIKPGLSLVYNGTGNSETVRTRTQERALSAAPSSMRLDRRDIQLLASQIAGAASPTVQMDGRQVAEITNRYSYLPAGV